MAKKPKAEPTPVGPPWEHKDLSYVAGRAAIDGADYLALQCEQKWGPGRLRLLVSDELRAKFDSQRLKFRLAILHGTLDDVKREAARMQNAWTALDLAATQSGAAHISSQVWEVPSPATGKVYALVKTPEEVRHVLADGRHVDVYTLNEIAHLLDQFALLTKVKETFPGAEITRVRPIQDPLQSWEDGDELGTLRFQGEE